MAITYKRQDELEKMLEKFASFEDLEKVEFPDPKTKQANKQTEQEAGGN